MSSYMCAPMRAPMHTCTHIHTHTEAHACQTILTHVSQTHSHMTIRGALLSCLFSTSPIIFSKESIGGRPSLGHERKWNRVTSRGDSELCKQQCVKELIKGNLVQAALVSSHNCSYMQNIMSTLLPPQAISFHIYRYVRYAQIAHSITALILHNLYPYHCSRTKSHLQLEKHAMSFVDVNNFRSITVIAKLAVSPSYWFEYVSL